MTAQTEVMVLGAENAKKAPAIKMLASAALLSTKLRNTIHHATARVQSSSPRKSSLGKLIGLRVVRKGRQIHTVHDAPQPVRNALCRFSPGLVTIEHHDHMAEILRQEILL